MKNQYKIINKIYIQLTDGSILCTNNLHKETYIKSDLDIKSHKLWQYNKNGSVLTTIEDRSLTKFKKKFSLKNKK